MSTIASPYGLRPVGKASAGYNSQGFDTRAIASGYGTQINFGDVVKGVADGTIEKDTGTTTLTPMGVFLGCEYTDAAGKRQHSQFWPAGQVSLDAKAKISTDPNDVFQIQADGSITLAAVGANAAIVQTAGVFGRSRNALQASSVNTTSGLPLRIVGIAEMPENAVGDAYTDVLVKFTNHQLTALAGI